MIYLELFCKEKHNIEHIFWETKFGFPTTGSTKKTFPIITKNTGKEQQVTIVIIKKCSKTLAFLGFGGHFLGNSKIQKFKYVLKDAWN